MQETTKKEISRSRKLMEHLKVVSDEINGSKAEFCTTAAHCRVSEAISRQKTRKPCLFAYADAMGPESPFAGACGIVAEGQTNSRSKKIEAVIAKSITLHCQGRSQDGLGRSQHFSAKVRFG